jgi:arginine decarboxylase
MDTYFLGNSTNMDQTRAPLLDVLADYHAVNRYAFTPPGHRQGPGDLMVEAVGANSAWFSTCGSSLSAKAAMMSAAGGDGGLLGLGVTAVSRSCRG